MALINNAPDNDATSSRERSTAPSNEVRKNDKSYNGQVEEREDNDATSSDKSNGRPRLQVRQEDPGEII